MFLKPHYFKQYPKAKLLPDLGLDCYRSAITEWDLDETQGWRTVQGDTGF